ncbi:hypothetical protein NA57DRAFT_15277, partial [Rhizodiscina lignyota]
MAPTTINVLISSFPGLGLPSTLSLPLPSTTTIQDLTSTLYSRLPSVDYRLLLTTNSNKLLKPTSSVPISSLLSNQNETILPLRLSVPLCGGKGGFGSQLRAAGGRMSSRKKQGADTTGSSRNLDGRRLRTVNEAKALAEYLAVKPEMARREKEERKKRWEAIVEAADKKEEELRNMGKKARLDEKWLEDKEEAERKTREAVLAALQKGEVKSAIGQVGESSGSEEASPEGSESEDEIPAKADANAKDHVQTSRTFFGWDEEDDFMSDENEE